MGTLLKLRCAARAVWRRRQGQGCVGARLDARRDSRVRRRGRGCRGGVGRPASGTPAATVVYPYLFVGVAPDGVWNRSAGHPAQARRGQPRPPRADIALAFITGTTITLDVRTTNTQSASAHGAASAEAHLRSQEREKLAKYAGYYRNFVHFVIDLGGAVNEDSYGALKEITREAANAAGPRLRCRIAVAMVRTTAWLATRAPASDCYAGLGRPSGPAAAGPEIGGSG